MKRTLMVVVSCLAVSLTAAFGAGAKGTAEKQAVPVATTGSPADKYPPNTWVPILWQLKIRDGALPPGVKTGRHVTEHNFGAVTYRPETGETLIMDGYYEKEGDSVLGVQGIWANGLYGMDPVTDTYTLYKVSNYRNGYFPTERNLADPTPVPRHTYDCWTYVPENRTLYIYGGANKDAFEIARPEVREAITKFSPQRWVVKEDKTQYMKKGAKILGMWAYSFDTMKWRTIDTCKLYPHGVYGYEAATVYVPSQKRLFFFPAHKGRVFSFDIVAEEWRDEGFDIPWNRYRGKTFMDVKRDRVVFYSGLQTSNATECEIGVYDVKSRKFSILPVKGVKPKAPRYDGTIVHDTRRDLYVAFGGSEQYDDNWVFDPNTNRWRQFIPERNIPIEPWPNKETRIHTYLKSVYDSKNDLVVLCRMGMPHEWYAMRFDPATARYVDNEAKP